MLLRPQERPGAEINGETPAGAFSAPLVRERIQPAQRENAAVNARFFCKSECHL